jgi:hypothetical protein
METKNFSKISFPYLRKIKKAYKVNKEIFKALYNNAYNKHYDHHGQEKTNTSNKVIDFLEISLLENLTTKNYINFYIDDPSLVTFFIDTNINHNNIKNIGEVIKIFNLYEGSGFVFLGKTVGTNDSGTKEIFSDKSNSYNVTGIIHQKILKESIIFQINYSIPDIYEYSNCIITDGATNTIGGEIIYENEIIEKFYTDFRHEANINNIINLVFNMLFYMDAFPDKILDSPPDECIDKLNCNNSKTITMSDEIKEYLHENRDVSPHLRRGHFRYLASDFYKNKKGQTIFVKSSFVKGQAKTIIE